MARRRKPRASWKGHLKLDLLSIPVQAFNTAARDGGEIHFHLLHAPCHSRIRYEKVCPLHGEVDNDEIVLAYEYAKNQYVEVEEEELERLRPGKSKMLSIETFIHQADLDPIFFDGRSYFLVPDGEEGRQPYVVLAEAMSRLERYAIGEVVFSGKEQLVLVRTWEDVLIMMMLHYAAEVQRPDSWREEIGKRRATSKERELAETLIEASTDAEFDFNRYENRYTEQLEELISAKVKGEEIVAPPAVEEEPEVINLMDALRKSVARVQKREPTNGKPSKRKRKSSPARRKRQAS